MVLVVSPVGIWEGGQNFTHSVYGITFSNKEFLDLIIIGNSPLGSYSGIETQSKCFI